MNDHYALNANENGRKGEMVKRLKENWNNSYKRADEIVDELWKKI
jgi:hypothetical protein